MAKTDSNVATLRDKGDPKRRDEALTSATHQLEAIFETVIAPTA